MPILKYFMMSMIGALGLKFPLSLIFLICLFNSRFVYIYIYLLCYTPCAGALPSRQTPPPSTTLHIPPPGILNVFNPSKPEGAWQLDLMRWEERQVAKMLVHLSVQEPGDNCKLPY
jgi:hypothetical protein